MGHDCHFSGQNLGLEMEYQDYIPSREWQVLNYFQYIHLEEFTQAVCLGPQLYIIAQLILNSQAKMVVRKSYYNQECSVCFSGICLVLWS